MNKLFGTIKSIFKSKIRKTNHALQVSNCIDLVDEQQVKMAQNYKKIVKAINDLVAKRDMLKEKINAKSDSKPKTKNTSKSEVNQVWLKNIEVLESTIARLEKNKEMLAAKLQRTEDSRAVLVAKKALLDSISDIKSTTSNVFEKQEFDVDAIMEEIDKSIRDIESEFQADDELNELVK